MITPPLFERLLHLSGLQNPSRVAEVPGEWELWTAGEQYAFAEGTSIVGIVVVSRPPTLEYRTKIRTALREHVPAGGRVSVLLKTAGQRTETVEDELKTALQGWARYDLWELPKLVSHVRSRLHRGRTRLLPPDPCFVDPAVEAHDVSEVQSASVALRRFLTEPGPGRVGVLLGVGGSGKTTVAAALCYEENVHGGPLTLGVVEEDWTALERRKAEITVESVLREALHRQGYVGLDIPHLDVLLANGGLSLVFDSFDQVCTAASNTAENEIIERVLHLAALEDSKVRVLLTARPEFWERVDPFLRVQCRLFRLRPFEEAEVEQYLQLRFTQVRKAPTGERSKTIDQGGLNRARDILAHLEAPDLRYLPLVLAHVCEAVLDRELGQDWLARTVAQIGRSNPLPGIARFLCEREHIKHVPTLSADDQLSLFCTLLAEFGPQFSEEELIVCAQVEYKQPLDVAERIRDHLLLAKADGGRRELRPDRRHGVSGDLGFLAAASGRIL